MWKYNENVRAQFNELYIPEIIIMPLGESKYVSATIEVMLSQT